MDQPLTLEALRQIDAACDRFEEAWRTGSRPSVEDFLRQADAPLRPHLLESLQKLQKELILRQFEEASEVDADADASPSLPPEVARKPAPQAAPAPEEDAGRTLNWDRPRVLLQVVAGPHEGREFVYDEHDTLLVGRSSRAQLRLNEDPHFSRHHFRLEVNPPPCYLMDLGSRNGTFVNGEKVEERFLVDGDLVSGGRTKMRVSIHTSGGEPDAPATPVTEAFPVAGPVARVPEPPRPAPERGRNDPAFREQPVPGRKPSLNDPDRPAVEGYQLHEQIGSGALGTVYRATRTATGESCAVKIMTPAARVSETGMQAFLREFSILNQLNHSHIVRLIEMGACGTDLFLSTEYLETVDWSELTRGWPAERKIRVACALMTQILAALEYAHNRELVHRDVKPGNILIHRANGKLAAKLADFGLAKQYTTAGMSRMTRPGDVIGSLPYMSPEQFVNSREARPTCDIYSAGATLYWMLTGEDPIALENHPCKFVAILEDPPVPLTTRCPEAPAALEKVVHRALEKTAEKRFACHGEMRRPLLAFAK